MRALAAALRAEGGQAEKVRTAVRRALQESDMPSILDLLACDLPDEPFDSLVKRQLTWAGMYSCDLSPRHERHFGAAQGKVEAIAASSRGSAP